METELIQKAEALAEEIFSNEKFLNHPYHNLEHTQGVVMATKEIGEKSSLNQEEMEAALIAAWLHDIGYLYGAENHEKAATDKAKEVLTLWGASPKTISLVAESIMSTKMPQQPSSMVSKVVCDADLYHLSAEDFFDRGDLLREEWGLHGKTLTDEEWFENCLTFLRSQNYHTPYGQTVLEKRKKKNVKKLKKKLDRESPARAQDLEDEIIKLRSKLDRAKTLKPDRGIETMFRVTSSNHIMLSGMADTKANIMISINSIILSVVVTVLIRKLEENPNLIIPTILLVSVCLSTIVFAVLATRPNVSPGRFHRDDIKQKRTNLLFFGNFYRMDLDNYEWAMKEMMKDADYLYGSLIKDIYFLGNVLGRKYQYLRISYNIFMFGFVLSVLSFILALFL